MPNQDYIEEMLVLGEGPGGTVPITIDVNGNVSTNGIAITWKGAYDSGTAYHANDAVSYNGSAYICIVDTPGGIVPTNITYWSVMVVKGSDGSSGTGITWRNIYSGTTQYAVNDAVSYNGSSYICILSSQGNIPTNTTYWALLASIGATGATGAAGPAGNDGAAGPNLVSTSTSTNLDGILSGDGAHVGVLSSIDGGTASSTPQTVLFKADTAANLGPIVIPAKMAAYSTDTHILKIGDGVTTWANLPLLISGVVPIGVPITGAQGQASGTIWIFFIDEIGTGVTSGMITPSLSTTGIPGSTQLEDDGGTGVSSGIIAPSLAYCSDQSTITGSMSNLGHTWGAA